ncbi:MAG: hypothetical protein Q8S26_14950 [Azonexus sp.]|nr:hypothetical protein [Azonexus sp.]
MLKPKRSRRRFVKLLGGLGAAWALPACESLADKPVSIASHVWVGYEPMFLARSEGWLDEKQVRIFETTAATESMRALAEGKVEGAALTLDEVFKARQEGQNLTVVMIYNISVGADMLLARAGIASLAERSVLVGLRKKADAKRKPAFSRANAPRFESNLCIMCCTACFSDSQLRH